MKLSEIQPTLFNLAKYLPILSAVQDSVYQDDGTKLPLMETSLKASGVAVLVMPPQSLHIASQSIGGASVVYVSTIWIRTNPKVKNDAGTPVFVPEAIVEKLIPAVLGFVSGRPGNFFKLPEGLEPDETDFSDVGNNSRLVRFTTPVTMP